ncbi:MAG TPA: hypothetical protein VGM73_14740 [Candidatus Didemnitutus sp.]|jgi:hypothetical protein
METLYKFLLSSGTVIAIGTAMLVFLGIRSEHSCWTGFGLPFYQFLPSTRDLAFKGFEIAKKAFWPAHLIWRLFLVIGIPPLCFAAYWLSGSEYREEWFAGIIILPVLLFWRALHAAAKHGENNQKTLREEGLDCTFVLKDLTKVKGCFLLFGNGYYVMKIESGSDLLIFPSAEVKSVLLQSRNKSQEPPVVL